MVFYSCKFGNFLCNSEQEKEIFEVASKTINLWTVLNHKTNIHKFLNPFYHESGITEFLNPAISANQIQFWSNFYDRSEKLFPGNISPINAVEKRILEMMEEIEKRDIKLLEEEIQLKKQLLEKLKSQPLDDTKENSVTTT